MKISNHKFLRTFLISFFFGIVTFSIWFNVSKESEPLARLTSNLNDGPVEALGKKDSSTLPLISQTLFVENNNIETNSISDSDIPQSIESMEEEAYHLSVLADPLGVLPSTNEFELQLQMMVKSLESFDFYSNWQQVDWYPYFMGSDLFAAPLNSLLTDDIVPGRQSEVAVYFSEQLSALQKVDLDTVACSQTTCLIQLETGFEVSLEKTGEFDLVTGEEITMFHHEMMDVFPDFCEPLTTNDALSQEELKVLVVCSQDFI